MMNNIFTENDLEDFIKSNGPLLELSGNIAPAGIQVDLSTVPSDMIGMRAVARLYENPDELARALRTGQIQDGNMIFLCGDSGLVKSEISLLEASLIASGKKHLALVLNCPPEKRISGIVNFYFSSSSDATKSYVSVIKEGDRTEYDVNAGLFGADLIECLDHRLGKDAADPFYYQNLANNIWVIGEEFTRMFLVVGSAKALLIDAGFGYGDLSAAVRNVTSLPYDVALTHGHFDHAGGIRFFKESRVYLHPDDYPNIEARQGKAGLEKLTPLADGQIFDLGDREIRTIHLPGHSKGSVVFYEEETGSLFAGDSLLCGPFFLLGGEDDTRRLRDGLDRLVHSGMNIQTIYPAHRERFPMTQKDLQEAVRFFDAMLSHSMRGVPTWIAPIDASPYKTYRNDVFSAYSI